MRIHYRNLLIIIFLTAGLISAQTELRRWEAREINYELASHNHIDSLKEKQTNSGSLLSLLHQCYSFFISDLDGDNCPFTPSCANFFMEAVDETNFFKGILMFADRFTRDLNLFKVYSDYSIKSGKFFDPPYNYTLTLR